MNNSVIAVWLRYLAGSENNFNKLLDWMACAPDLDKPLCGLIFAGPPQTGKSLFAEGLVPLWKDTPDITRVCLVSLDYPTALHTIDPVQMDDYNVRYTVGTHDPKTLIQHVVRHYDLEWLERRYLYLEHTEAAANYLEFHKNRPLDQWATRDIADIAIWLSENRKVERAGHLWVEGTPGAMRHLVGKKGTP